LSELAVLDNEKIEQFNREIAKYIGVVFASAWVPVPGAATVVEIQAERELARFGFDSFLPDLDTDTEEQIIRLFRRKRFALKAFEIVPFAGSVISILHIYGKGMFILQVATRSEEDSSFWGPSLDEKLSAIWTEFEPSLWDGTEILSFYRETTGGQVSSEVETQFENTLRAIETKYKEAVENYPGFDAFQEKGEAFMHISGEIAREAATEAVSLGKTGAKELVKLIIRWLSKPKP